MCHFHKLKKKKNTVKFYYGTEIADVPTLHMMWHFSHLFKTFNFSIKLRQSK